MAETTTQRRKTAPQPKGKEGLKCGIEGCKRAYQAKGYCFFHYDKWKNGELPKSRYKTCSKEGCLKKVVEHGLSTEDTLVLPSRPNDLVDGFLDMSGAKVPPPVCNC